MKKFFKYGLVLSSVLVLAACGNSSGSTKSSDPHVAENADIKIEVKGGTYVLPRDESADSKYLAVELKITNKSDKKIEMSSSDFKFYDADEDEVSAINVYAYETDFETMSFDSISGGKSKTTYLVYEVDEDESYSLHYVPMFDEKAEELEVTVDSSDYEDSSESLIAATENYVNAVFLNKETSSSSSDKEETTDKEDKKDKEDTSKSEEIVLANDIKEAKEEFIADYVKEFTDEFFYYTPSEAEAKTFIQAYIAENAKRAKVTYTLKTYLPDYAEIYVRPEVIDLSTVDFDSISEKFVDDNSDNINDYSELHKASEKFVIEHVPTILNTAIVTTSSSMYDKEGYLMRLSKNKDGEWEMDTSSESYYDYLVETFSGLNINY